MGNKTGWIAAGILAVAILVIVLWVVFFPSISKPTREMLLGINRSFQDVKVSLRDVLGGEPTGGGNAADDYQQAAVLVPQILQIMENRPEGSTAMPAAALELMKKVDGHVASGAAKKECKYLFVHTPKRMEVSARLPEIDGIFQVTGAMDMLAQHLAGQKQLDAAWKVYERLLVMGRHFMNERSHPQVVFAGIGAQRVALQGFTMLRRMQIQKDEKTVDAINRYASDLYNLEKIYGDKLPIIWKVRPDPGNVFWVIEYDPDRAWRVQALLTMGILKFTAQSRGDRKHVETLLVRCCSDADPFIKAAAEAARAFTRDDLATVATK